MSDSHGHDAGKHEEHPKVPYMLIAGTLLLFTVITVLVSFWDLHSKAANVILAFAIAAFKASLVMLFFMHLKYEKKQIVLIAIAPFLLVGTLFFALFPDVVYGQYHDNYKEPGAAEHGKEGGHGKEQNEKKDAATDEHKEKK